MLNWTTENILLFIGAIPFFMAFLLLFFEYRRFKDRSLALMMFGWLFYGIYLVVEGLSYLLLSPSLFITRSIFMVLVGFCVGASLDLMDKDRIDPLKKIFITGLGVFTIFSSQLPDAYELYQYENGQLSYATSGLFFIGLTLLSLYIATVYLYFMVKIYRQSPENLKKSASVVVIGAVFVGPLAILLYVSRISTLIPGIIPIFSGLGALITAFVLSRHPQLAYVLPARAIQLAVIREDTGYLEFIHHWVQQPTKTQKISDLIFSSLIQQVVRLFERTLGVGEIQEIKIRDAVLLIQRLEKWPYLITLMASNSTRSIRNNLTQFIAKFQKNLVDTNLIQNSDPAQFCINTNCFPEILHESFPYIPVYTEHDNIGKLIAFKSVENPNQTRSESNRKIGVSNNISSLCISCHNIKVGSNSWTDLMNFYQSAQSTRLSWEICPKCKKDVHFLILSYFDLVLGPKILYYFPEGSLPDYLENVSSIMDLDNKEFFLYTLNNSTIANYAFSISAPELRGSQINLLLSLSVQNSVINENFAQSFLFDCVKEIQSMPNLQELFRSISSKTQAPTKGIGLDLYNQLKNILLKNYQLLTEKKVDFHIHDQLQKIA